MLNKHHICMYIQIHTTSHDITYIHNKHHTKDSKVLYSRKKMPQPDPKNATMKNCLFIPLKWRCLMESNVCASKFWRLRKFTNKICCRRHDMWHHNLSVTKMSHRAGSFRFTQAMVYWIARTHLLSSDFAHLYLLSSDFNSLLCFLVVHIVGSWTSKFPSTNIRWTTVWFVVEK